MKNQSKENMAHNYRCLKKLRLKNQLLILISFLIIFVVTFLVCSNYIHTTFVQFYFTQASEEIYTKFSNTFIQTQMSSYQSYFTSLLNSNGQTLISFYQLYEYLTRKNQEQISPLNPNYNMNFGGKTPNIPQPIISSFKISNYNSTISFICYTNKTKFHTPYTEDEILILKTQEQLQAFGPILFKGNTTFQSLLSAFVKRDNILMTYPCLQRYDVDNYIPENRTWYKELTRNYNNHVPYNHYNFSLTAPYLLFNSIHIGLSMTLPFVNEKLELIGGVSFDLVPSRLFGNLIQQFGQDFTSIYLVSLEGILIMHPYNITPNQLPLYFYNSSITGFTKDDWDSLNNITISSKCKNQTTQKGLNCLFNSFYNQDMFVTMQTIPSYNISIVVLTSSSEINKFQEDYNRELLNNFTKQFHLGLVELISVFVFFSVVIYFTTNYLFNPIETIIDETMSKIQKRKLKPKMISQLQQAFLSVQIFELYQSCQNFHKLFERLSFNKSKQCEQIENLQYPSLKEIYTLSEHINFRNFKSYSKKKVENNLEHYFLIKNIVLSALKNERKQ